MDSWLKFRESLNPTGPSSGLFDGNTTNVAGGSNGGTNYLGWANIGMQGLDAIGSVLGARVAKKNYELNKEAFQFNKEMQSATTLANIQNRIAQYKAVNPNADVSYLNNLAQRLQSYLPQQQNQMPRPAQPVSVPQQAQPQTGFETMTRYGRGG